MPNETPTDTPLNKSHLSEDQLVRVEALWKAQVLLTLAHRPGSSDELSAVDLHSLAVYIETGNDPWIRSHEPAS